jgi:hypothetical protein
MAGTVIARSAASSSSNRSTKFNGANLGAYAYYIARRRIVEALGGTVGVRSGPDQGATFTVGAANPTDERRPCSPVRDLTSAIDSVTLCPRNAKAPGT